MAIQDAIWLLSSGVALPGSATDEYTTSEVDVGAGKDAWGAAKVQNIAQGRPLYINFRMLTVASTGSSPTLTVALVGGTTTAPTTVVQTICSAVAAATLVAGYGFSVALAHMPSPPRFMRGKITAGNAGFTTGTYEMWISDQPIDTLQ